MPNFNDFLASIDEETIIAIMDDANQKVSAIRDGMEKRDPSYYGNQIGAIAFTVALELLGFYHKWIEETKMD